MLWLRILLAWLLIAALPMQGFAAASMLFCGMGMQHVHAASTATDATDVAHDHAAMRSRTDSADVSHTYPADPADPADLAVEVSQAADHTCRICAACCNGVALVGLNHMVAVAPAPQAALAEPFVRVHTRPSPVPDKPPRA